MALELNGTTGVQGNSGAFVAGTAVATTSGTSVDITGIPSWVKRVTVVFNEISTNGISAPMLQIGDSGGVETTGYLGSTSTSSGGVTTSFAFTTGFGLAGTNGVAGNFFSGSVTITSFSTSTNTWMCSGVIGFSNVAATSYLGSSKTLSTTLDRVRITTVGGTDTFDSGSMNILYE
jgi:hypothetical protein